LKCNAHAHKIRHIVYDIYRARESDCKACPLRLKCLSRPGTKRRYLTAPIDDKKLTLAEEMRAKIDTQQGRKIYSKRLAIVEPVFANIRSQKRMDRFTLRTRAKIDLYTRATRGKLKESREEGIFMTRLLMTEKSCCLVYR